MRESIETTHAELEERLRFETLLAETSSRFVNVPADQVDGVIEAAQRRLCFHAARTFSSPFLTSSRWMGAEVKKT